MSSNTDPKIESAKSIVLGLTAEAIKKELRRMDAETQALRVLLRAARARERHNDDASDGRRKVGAK